MKEVFFGLFVFWSSLGYSFSEKEYKSFLEEQAKDFIKKNNAAGLAIGVYKEAFDLEKPFQKIFCFGQARRSRKINVCETTLFRLGPLAKLFTVFLLLKFEEQGKCKLDDAVEKYFPKTFAFPAYQALKPTLKQLAMELSGLPSKPTIALKTTQVSENEIRVFFKNYKLTRAPGKKYEPSELGYGCLTYLLSRQAKMSYPDILYHEVLEPLGMLDTVSSISFSKTYKLAFGHKGISEVGDLVYQKDGSFFKGVLGWSSTIEDMQKLLSFLLTRKTKSLESIAKTLYKTHYIFPENPVNKLSIGWRVSSLSSERQVPVYFQHVSYQGYDHFIGVIPEVRGGVVILSNSEYSVEDLAKKLLEEFFK